MTIRRLRTAVDSQGHVTFWLPVRGWPVVSLTVLRRSDQETLWHVLNEGLSERGSTFSGTLEVHSATATVARESKEMAIDSSGTEGLPVRYGESPPHMHQLVPDGEPAALTADAEYLVAVREEWGSDLQRFALSLPAKHEAQISDVAQ
jgi:hypothetical protein